MMGTPYYKSPEQARGRNIDWRSDLWALGVIVFQCLTGKPPFESEALGDLMGMILYDPIPKITQRDSSLPPELEAFWERAVNREREKRFQSAKELSDALAQAAMLDRREVPTLPPRPSLTSLADSDHASLPPMSHTIGSSGLPRFGSSPNLSDASESDLGTGAPVSRSRLATLGELTPKQRKLAMFSGVAALALIGFGVFSLTGRSSGAHAAGDAADAPVAEPAAPPVPAVSPRLANEPAAPPPSLSASAPSPPRELDDEQKKKDKKKRVGPSAPAAGPPGSPDYGI
jgi:serine/threonine-protein kinase